MQAWKLMFTTEGEHQVFTHSTLSGIAIAYSAQTHPDTGNVLWLDESTPLELCPPYVKVPLLVRGNATFMFINMEDALTIIKHLNLRFVYTTKDNTTLEITIR